MESLVFFKVFIPTTIAFVFGILIAPLITHFLYKHKVWKVTGGKDSIYGGSATVFNKLKGEGETQTPRMGGIVIWLSVFATVSILFTLKTLFPDTLFNQLDFFSRSQTWIPLCVLAIGAGAGFLNDYYDVRHQGKGLRLRTRLVLITALSGAIGWWFYSKLGVDSVGTPFASELYVGALIIPIFILLTNALYASGVIDGIDGLSGGVFSIIFAAYAGIALTQSQLDLAALSATIAGATLAFLWFNIPPARFWMTETGSMALTLTLAVIVFMTDSLGGGESIFLLPIIGLPLVATVLSNLIQLTYRKTTGKKFFHIAPLHHHFEAVGWPSYKVTMRYWVITIICAIIGISLSIII